MRRTTDGKYVVSKYINLTGALLEGIGDTMEEAKARLKEEVRKYREGLATGSPDVLGQSGEFTSPGMLFTKNERGAWVAYQEDARKVPILSRPDIIASRKKVE